MMGSNDTIKQLDSARDIVLRDPAIYPQVVPGVLPVIGLSQPVELRRWGADFLAETFASPVVSAEDKGKMCLGVLDTLKAYLNRKEETGEEEDPSVLQSAVQCVASIYPLVFRHAIAHAHDGAQEAWSKMANLKSAILRSMDAAPAGVRICCIKFVARVVQVQTPGLIADPRKPDQNEISLALVPREHAFLNPSNLEAEASGLLDRLLSVLQDHSSDALIVTSTLNALATLVHRRASSSTKILSTILAFNPFRVTATPKDKIASKSMTRTTISFLHNVLKRAPSHASAARIQSQIERLRQVFTETFLEQNGLKRGPDEPIDGQRAHKRAQLDPADAEGGGAGNSSTPLSHPQPDGALPPGPVSYKDLYTLTPDPRAAGFDVQILPHPIVAQLVPALLQAVNPAQFDQALNVLRARVLELQRRPPSVVFEGGNGGVLGGQGAGDGEEEDEEYDPSALGIGETDQVSPGTASSHQQPLEVMRLPPEPALSEEERMEYGDHAQRRLFGTLRQMDEDAGKRRVEKKQGSEKEKIDGFNGSLLVSSGGQEREGWIALLIRLATRSNFHSRAGEDDVDEEKKDFKREDEDGSLLNRSQSMDLPSKIRDALNRYIMDDWRRRIDVAIAWLNEEWYADRIASKQSSAASNMAKLPNYTPLTLTLLDQLVPYIDTKDGRYLIRFLSEIPYLPRGIFDRIKKIAEDPERVHISTQTLLYLIMLRPPVREDAIQCAEEMWRENPDAKAQAEKILAKWRPTVLQDQKNLAA